MPQQFTHRDLKPVAFLVFFKIRLGKWNVIEKSYVFILVQLLLLFIKCYPFLRVNLKVTCNYPLKVLGRNFVKNKKIFLHEVVGYDFDLQRY